MKRLALLHEVIVEELGDRCGISTSSDVKTIRARVKDEGESFLTLTLPTFGKGLERALDQGLVTPSLFPRFSSGKRGFAPQFLRGFTGLIFDLQSGGRLLDCPSTEAIYALRQITLMFGKINLPCTPERVRKAVDGYVQTESETRALSEIVRCTADATRILPEGILPDGSRQRGSGRTPQPRDGGLPGGGPVLHGSSIPGSPPHSQSSSQGQLLDGEALSQQTGCPDTSAYRRISGLLWRDLFCALDSDIWKHGVVPRHSAGATADKLSGNGKYWLKQWTSRLENVFPHYEMLIPSESFIDRLDDVEFHSPDTELPVKVVTVPKTLATPRIIAEEPTCMQYVQQGILRAMVKEIRANTNARKFVKFDSQKPNQRLAREGSITGALATLDLSEASDRVAVWHVEEMLARHRILREAVMACRSTKAKVPGHGVITLSKFASMGSALTFPIESLVFLTVVFVGIEKALNRPLTTQDILNLHGKVRVYGDDIIVPTDYVQSVLSSLGAFGFKVNTNKSFWTGKFRESCGSEWYDGVDVSIVRCRSLLPEHGRISQKKGDTKKTSENNSRIVSSVEFRNHLYQAGLWKAASFLDEILGKLIPFPNVEATSSILGRLSVFPNEEFRWDDDLHIPLVRGLVVVSKSPINKVDDYAALMKWMLRDGDEPLARDHLERSGRPVAVRIKRRWKSPW